MGFGLRFSLFHLCKQVFFKDACIFSKEAEQQARHKHVQVVRIVSNADMVIPSNLVVNLCHLVGSLHVGIVLLNVANLANAPHGREEFIVGIEIVQVVFVGFLHGRVESLDTGSWGQVV